jgi:hypothetical protein
VSIRVTTGRVLPPAPSGATRLQVLDDTCAIVTPEWALPFHYAAEPGDLLRLIGQHGHYWVTGVMHGKGRSTLAFRGPTTLHAHGELRLRGCGGVRIQAPQVELRAAATVASATTIVQHAEELHTAVHELLEERAGQCARTIDGEDTQMAQRHETVAAHAVRMDAALLRLS